MLKTSSNNPPVMRRVSGTLACNKWGKKLIPRLWKELRIDLRRRKKHGNDEPTSSNVLPKNLTTIKSKNYGILRHNSRTCKGKIATDRQLVKGSNKVTKAKKQRKTSTKESSTVLTQWSQAPQTQETNSWNMLSNVIFCVYWYWLL